ncbi:MAG: 4-hydroxy-3-methylbut-2-enyl diphosphate reductase [Candidatus Ancillula trichonymphae]|jgi:4-hydroxy-3-methylbut-2-enyl diphosphate reductase|nr:4-hydroxy-3-methylbut-2-enyl diphosphate reductase [Candidatus Ancillula trichonymphae]
MKYGQLHSCKSLYLASPRGFCAGVSRAISTAELALERFGAPIFVRKEIVHNACVVRELSAKGVVFIEELDDIAWAGETQPTVVFSAHGVSPAVFEAAKRANLRVIDATCPLVERVHKRAKKCAEDGYNILLIGHKDHDEIQGTLGVIRASGGKVQVVERIEDLENLELEEPCEWLSQTTLSRVDTLEIARAAVEKFPFLKVNAGLDICYATTNRQAATHELAKTVGKNGVILVVGSKNSSNMLRLVEEARRLGVDAFRLEDADALDAKCMQRLVDTQNIGITSGASVPERLVEEIVHKIVDEFPTTKIQTITTTVENTHFALPGSLQK